MLSRRLCAITGIMTLRSKFPFAPAQVMVAVGADDLAANHHDRFAHDRVHFARHDRAAGLGRGQLNLADAAARTAAEPANVVRDLEETDRDRLEMAARFDHAILGALRFEMIFRFAKCDAGALLEMAHHFRREIRGGDSSPVPTAVPPSASSCSAAIACSARRFPKRTCCA